MTLAIDGSVAGSFGTGVSSKSVTLTTTNSNDLIIVFVATESASISSAPTVSSVSATGLSFSKRAAIGARPGGGGFFVDLEEWYAVAASPFSGSITVQLSAICDDGTIVAFGVSGANTSSPFDGNASIPDTGSAGDLTISTSNANDMIIWASGGCSADAVQATPSNFSQIDQEIDSSGDENLYENTAYQVVSSTQTNLVIGSASSYNNIADAIVQGGPVQPPFVPPDLPNPLRLRDRGYGRPMADPPKSAALWSPTGPGGLPFFNRDWPNPVRLRDRGWLRPVEFDPPNLQLILNFVNTKPFSQIDWPLPNRSIRRPTVDPPNLSILHFTNTQPFAQADWPNPVRLRDRGWLRPIVIDPPNSAALWSPTAPPGGMPFRMQDWPNPVRLRDRGWLRPVVFDPPNWLPERLTVPPSDSVGWVELYCPSAPAVPTVYTSGSGTYTTPTGALWLRVRLIGGGGGGAGGGNGGTGGNGGSSTFGSSLLTAGGGTGGATGTPGGGGAASGGFINMPGGSGQPGTGAVASTINEVGGIGGCGFFGGEGTAGNGGTAPVAPAANSGCGGGGGASGAADSNTGSGGGGAGGYVEAVITSPAATYSYSVGTSGGQGTAGSTGNDVSAGGAGAAGIIIVEAFYQ